jgi:creatinine amidohydrolase
MKGTLKLLLMAGGPLLLATFVFAQNKEGASAVGNPPTKDIELNATQYPEGVKPVGVLVFTKNKQGASAAGNLPVKYEELNATQFPEAVKRAGGVCIIPTGILEKHGPHLPLGTDMIDIREVALRAANSEYAIVFPEYYFGQIFEAKHQPGTIAYSHELIWNLLQETCDELARNGLKKIVIANGHGGNNNFLKYFCQAQLEKKRDYAVYMFTPPTDQKLEEQLKQLRKTQSEGHAGEVETSTIMAERPELVDLRLAASQSGADQARLRELKSAFTGIWWYAKFPNHYAGDGSTATPEIGKLAIESKVAQLVEMLQSVKQDKRALQLQEQFYHQAEDPLQTKQ